MARKGDERNERPDPEVVPVGKRRQYTAGEKLRRIHQPVPLLGAGASNLCILANLSTTGSANLSPKMGTSAGRS